MTETGPLMPFDDDPPRTIHEFLASDDERPRARGTVSSYVIVHPDGTRTDFTGDGRELIDYLNGAQDDAYIEGEMAAESLADLPDIDAVWVATYDRERLPENPVAAHMVQVFDLGERTSTCRGIVAFGPYLVRDAALAGHRRLLLFKIHAEIRTALANGDTPRQRLWPSEMITASRDVSPTRAWEEFQSIRTRTVPSEKITQVIREHEQRMREAQRRGEYTE